MASTIIWFLLMYLVPVILISLLIVRMDAEPKWMILAVPPVINVIVLMVIVILTISILKMRGEYE